VLPRLTATHFEPVLINLTIEPIFEPAVENATLSAALSLTVNKVSAVAADMVIV